MPDIHQQHHKLVAAQAGDGVTLSLASHQAIGDLLQQAIALVMPQRVVHIFEVVKVEQQQGAMTA